MSKIVSQTVLKNKFQVRLNMLMEKTTQSNVAKKTGVSRQNIAKYLSGKALPNTYTLYLLANYFNVSCEYLLGLQDGTSNDTNYIIDRTGLTEEAINILEKFNKEDEWKFETFAINSLITYENYDGHKFLVSLGKYISAPNLDSTISEAIYSLILSHEKLPEIPFIGTKNNDLFIKKEYFKTDDIIYYQMIKEFNLVLDDIKNNPKTKIQLIKHIIDIINPYYHEALDFILNDGNTEDAPMLDKAILRNAMETYLAHRVNPVIDGIQKQEE